jgi:hypothetical protein
MTKDFNQNFYNTHIMPRFDQNNKFSMFTLDFSYVFYSEHDIAMEMIPATMEKTEFIKNTNLISGEYNIAKWIRPVSPAFEIVDDQKVLTIKRGDPLYYIRFRTDKKVNLIRVEQSTTVEKVEKACARLKFFVPRNTLQETVVIDISASTGNQFGLTLVFGTATIGGLNQFSLFLTLAITRIS